VGVKEFGFRTDEKDADGTDERRFTTVKKSVMVRGFWDWGRATGMR